MTAIAEPLLVLIVEDNADLRNGLAALLKSAQRLTFTAGTVDEAGRHLDALVFSHVLLDLELSDGSGMEILRRLRGEGRPTSVAILSGRADAADLADARALGVDAVFVKPPDWDKLLDWAEQPTVV